MLPTGRIVGKMAITHGETAMIKGKATPTPAPPKRRLFIGGAVFLIGFMGPAFVPLVAIADLSTEWKTALSGLLLLGIPELFMLIAVVILGRPGFEYFKGLLLKAITPPAQVSRTRYRLGLVLFVLPLLLGWLMPYISPWLPGYSTHPVVYGVVGDAVLLISLWVLGGEFWDKLRALFIHDARAQVPRNGYSTS